MRKITLEKMHALNLTSKYNSMVILYSFFFLILLHYFNKITHRLQNTYGYAKIQETLIYISVYCRYTLLLQFRRQSHV